MSANDTPLVYELHSTIELPLDRVHEILDDLDLPAGIAAIDITRRNNTLIISADPVGDAVSKYTPTAQLKATVSEKRVPKEPVESPGAANLQWGRPRGRDEDDDEPVTELVEYAGFKGTLDTVLQNTELQYEMFQILRELSKQAEQGTLTAITGVDGSLEATRIVDGEERPASVEVVEQASQDDDGNGVNWRENEFIR